MEEAYAEIVFETSHAFADCRAMDTKSTPRAGEAAKLSRPYKGDNASKSIHLNSHCDHFANVDDNMAGTHTDVFSTELSETVLADGVTAGLRAQKIETS